MHPSTALEIPAPKTIAAELSRRVIGQEEAVREISVALAKKLAGLRVGHILMIGSSGTGKTTLMRAVEELLAARPDLALRSTVVRMHANVLGEEAERGRPGEAVLWRLLERAREQLGPGAEVPALLERARRGLVFVDEIDKIRSHVGDRPNVPGIRAQEALLTLIENEAIPLRLPDWAGGGVITVDSSGLLFVCAGAFEGLWDAVYDRVTIGRDRGQLRATTTFEPGKVDEQLRFSLRDWLRNEDLFDYGMSPQFLSRFDAVVLLHDLGIDELVRIFLEAPESGFAVAREYFASHGKRLTLSPAAVRRIAAEAAKQPRLGARALKEVFRRVIRDQELDPESAAPGGVLVIDVPEVESALRRE
ncbi:MAG TPA: AAA family ATPase [Thermoanaerobaculia bacterium]|nr:AAA family ATPase [Thermoanaerobaculia bacterium]